MDDGIDSWIDTHELKAGAYLVKQVNLSEH